MSITTKTGDKGDTGLFGGKRVKKYDAQVEAYGALDEATCFIGAAHQVVVEQKTQTLLTDIQFHLYIIMAYLSDAKLDVEKVKEHLTVLETAIGDLEATLPKLIRFVLPQGTEETVRLHVARAMVRSAERRTVAFVDSKKSPSADDLLCIRYLNRLSDLLFLLARKYNTQEQVT